ncbi:hypothetical protein D3C87_1938770 [compost metagenome]
MRRQTTKQPRGPAVSATPIPATMARMKKSSNMALSLPLAGGNMILMLMLMLMAAAAFAMVAMMVAMVMHMVVAILGVAMIGH